MFSKLAWSLPLVLVTLVVINGCAEGPLWRTGYLSPRIRQKWEDEEKIAATIFGKRQQMQTLVKTANEEGSARQEEAAKILSDVVSRDPVQLLRIEAVELLAELPVESAAAGVRLAARDREAAVRRAAVKSLGKLGDEQSAATLASLSRNDENVDVRISATAELGKTRGAVTMDALRAALQHPNPAMQLRAADALASITGQGFGDDIRAWQDYMQTIEPTPETTRTAEQPDEDSGFRR